MEIVNEWIRLLPGSQVDIQSNIITTLFLIIALWVLRFVAIRIMLKNTEDIRSRYIWQKTITYITLFLGIFLPASLWIEEVQDLTTFLGLLSAGIAITLKDIFVNVAGWVFLTQNLRVVVSEMRKETSFWK